MNSYVDLATLKTACGLATTDTADDAVLLSCAESASREADDWCSRHFYSAVDVRTYTARNATILLLPDDLLSITTLETDDDSFTYPDAWSATDYLLQPSNVFPKWKVIRRHSSDYWFPSQPDGVQISGIFGYGDGESASPWKASGATITVNSTTGTTLTASSGAAFRVGQTIRVGSEQCYISAIATNNLTAIRGVNGTTAAIHTTVAASIAQYPRPVVEATLRLAQRSWRLRSAPFGVSGSAEMGTETVYPRGDQDIWGRLGPYRKVVVV